MTAVKELENFAGTGLNRVSAFGSDQKAPVNRELMLSLRWLSGKAEAFQYSYLYNIQLSEDHTEVLLHFGGHTVKIEGENLVELYNALLGWGIQFIQQMKDENRKNKKDPFVQTISVSEKIG